MLYHNARLVGTHLLIIDALAFVAFAVLSIRLTDGVALASPGQNIAFLAGLCAMAFLFFIVIGNRLGAYHARRTERLIREVASLAEVTTYALAFSIALGMALGLPVKSGSILFVALICLAGMISLRLSMRLVIRRWRRKGKDDQIWLIIGGGDRAENLAKVIRENKHFGIRIHDIVDLPNSVLEGHPSTGPSKTQSSRTIADIEDIRDVIKQNVIDEIVITLPLRSFYDETQRIISIGREAGIRVMLQPDAFGQPEYKSELTMAGNIPMVTHFTGPSNYVQLGIKRLMDILGALVGLIVLSPLFAAIAVAIKLDSRGPVLFLSERIGLHGRKFQMVKFRSMVSNAPELQAAYADLNQTDGVAFKIKEDPRVTRVGRILRSYHLDELAQLWNVLVGDMSLVGPRPLPGDEAGGREWWHLRRLSMPPGLTCFWQIRGDHEMPFKEWAKLDLKYIDNWSVWLDLKLISRTVLVVLRGPGW